MTKEEILAMEAGRELDELVATQIKGEPKPDYVVENVLDLQLTGDPAKSLGGNWLFLCEYDKGDIPTWYSLPFSTDISAAWPVAVKMGLALFPLNNKDWGCCKASHIYHVELGQDHYADPNLVICRE
ncbi:unnamed protein product, partial [marine sediment metagenome]